jgi:hypothetical protein
VKKKVLILFTVAVVVFTITETMIFSKRIEDDESYITGELEKRDQIGKRALVGRKLIVDLNDEKMIANKMADDEEFKMLLADKDSLVTALEKQNNRILAEIITVADNGDGHNFRLVIFNTEKKAIFRYQETFAKANVGGIIVIDLRLYEYAETEAAIAGVIAHEVAHILLRHSSRENDYQRGLNLFFYWPGYNYYFGARGPFGIPITYGKRRSREQEEADILAVQYIYAIGYEPEEYLKTARKLNIEQERIAVIEKEIETMRKLYPANKLSKFKFITKEQFLKTKQILSERNKKSPLTARGFRFFSKLRRYNPAMVIFS